MAARFRKFYSGLSQELRAFAERFYVLNLPDKDGFSYREHIEGLLARTRQDRQSELQAELSCPPFPLELEYVWNAFHRLSARRGSNGYSANPISWPDIDAFVRRSGVKITPWEVQLIEMLDDVYRSELHKKQSEK